MLAHVSSTPAERWHTETVLAAARIVLATGSMFAVLYDPTEPSRYAALAYVLLASYMVESWLVFWYVRHSHSPVKDLPRRFVRMVHGIDLLWPVIIGFFTDGPSSPFFLFVSFALLATAYRWGLRETIVASVLSTTLLMAEAAVLTVSNFEGSFEVNRLVMRSIYLLMLGILLGYLSEQEKRSRMEVALRGGLLQRLKSQNGLGRAMGSVLHEFSQLTGAAHAMVFTFEKYSAKGYRWFSDPAQGKAAVMTETNAGEWPLPLDSFVVSSPVKPAKPRLEILPGADFPVVPAPGECPIPEGRHPWLAIPFDHSSWKGHLVLSGVTPGLRPADYQRLQNLVSEMAPLLYSSYLQSASRARLSSAERMRMGRELHDSTLQSLISLSMRIHLLPQNNPASEELARIEQAINQEVLNLRDLMQSGRLEDVNARELPDVIAEMVERLRNDTAIKASFICDVEKIDLPAKACREVARIVQEALTNVRKHSRAKNAIVRLSASDMEWHLVIDDDGVGFPVSGHSTDAGLTGGRGPAVIKERVRILGGRLTIESQPSLGSRLEITFKKGASA